MDDRPRGTPEVPSPPPSDAPLTGTLYAYVAFDWGDEVRLEQARTLVPAESQVLPRRRRTPLSIRYRPPPLRCVLESIPLEVPEIGTVQAQAEVIVFDFAAASVSLRIPFQLSTTSLARLASHLTQCESITDAAHKAVQPLHRKLLPAIQDPLWSELTEEYFVFHFHKDTFDIESVVDQHPQWLAALLRMELEPLHAEEIAEAMKLQIRYGLTDLLLADWAAAVVVDDAPEDTLQVIEFANLQLLEFREIDNRLDDRLAKTYQVVHALARGWLPFWRPYTVQLRSLGELKVEANGMFERTQNVLKLVGDQYLARVYRLLAARFHLDVWERSIERSLNVIEGSYRVLSEQGAAWRAELLELTIVVLIVVEIALNLLGLMS
jgi:hypothetical protein